MSDVHDEPRGRPAPALSVTMTAREVLEAIDLCLTPIVMVLLKAVQDGEDDAGLADFALERLVPLMDEIEGALGLDT